MKNSDIIILLLTLLYPSSNAVTIKLSALRPDLEFFRGTWLQNPENVDVQGRIIFSDKSEIVVKFEPPADVFGGEVFCYSDLVDAWRNDSLQLENIDTAVEVLFYKHGIFYSRRHRCDVPDVLDKDSWVKMLPIKPENDWKESLEIRYISLKTLGKEIEREVSRIDTEKTGMEGLISKSTRKIPVTLTTADNQFAFDYEKGRRFVNITDVRTIQLIPQSTDFDEEEYMYKGPEHLVDFAVTRDYHFITFDRRLQKFLSPGGEELGSRWMVRSNVGNTTLRVGVGSSYQTVCVPTHLCNRKQTEPQP